MKEKTWGGARPGSGRKPADPKDKRVQMVITVDRETRDLLRWTFTNKGMRPGKTVDLLVDRYLDQLLTE